MDPVESQPRPNEPWRSVSSYSHIGTRYRQEDRVQIKSTRSGSVGILAIFDGHSGPHVADALCERLEAELDRSGAIDILLGLKRRTPPKRARKRILPPVREAFESLNESLGPISKRCGSTATVALISAEVIVLAQVGDSYATVVDPNGAILGHTTTHAVGANDAETRRLHMLGTEMSIMFGRLPSGEMRAAMYAHDRGSNMSLGMTRAFGDSEMGFVLPVPDVTVIPRPSGTDARLLLALASDGFTDAYPKVVSKETKVCPITAAAAAFVDHDAIGLVLSSAMSSSASDVVIKAVERPEWRGDNTSIIVAVL